MIDTFFYAFNAVTPILLTMMLGYLLRRLNLGSDDFFRQLNRLCFRVFLPIQLFKSVLGIRDLSELNWRMLLSSLAGFALLFLVGFLCARAFVPDRRQQGVVLQAAYRSNQSLFGLPLSEALGGPAALASTSLLCALFVPLYNALAVIVLTIYSDTEEHVDKRRLVRGVVHNPPIIAISIALVIVVLRQLFPGTVTVWQRMTAHSDILGALLTSLSRLTSPLMLVALGARFSFRSSRTLLGKIALGTALRLIVSPCLALGLTILLRPLLGLSTADMAAIVALFASPVATSSAVMVQEIGGDEQLANQLVVWSSALCTFTLFLMAFALRAAGLL